MGLLNLNRTLMRRTDSDGDNEIRGVESISDCPYRDSGSDGNLLDIFWSTEHCFPLPLVLYFNCDSFDNSNRSRARELCRVIAKRGYVVINAEFRNFDKNIGISGQFQDLYCLASWISKNHTDKTDLKKTYVTGSSYGAQMALWAAMWLSNRRLQEIVEPGNHGIRIMGLGLFTGMTDLFGGDTRMRSIGKAFRDLTVVNPKLAEALDVWHNHDLGELPPVFQATAALDSSRSDVEKLDELLETNLIPHETITFEMDERLVRGFMEKHPRSNEASRTISRMFYLFDRVQ